MILAQHEVIGTEEQRLLREFVADGGMLIADVRPGIYGARGKARQGGALDDLFGVRHRDGTPAVPASGGIEGIVGHTPVQLNRHELYVNPNVDVTTGQALGQAGGVPICIVHAVGKGHAILLNFTMWLYPKLAVHKGPEDAAEFLRALFSEAGIKAPLELTDDHGRRHRNVETMRWRTGEGVEVIALHGPSWGTWPEPNGALDTMPAPFGDGMDTSVPITLNLSEPRHVYEMRTGRGAGPTKTFQTSVIPFIATLLAVSHRPLHAPALYAVADNAARGDSLKLHVAIPRSLGGRALKIRVANPAGEDAPWFARSIIVRDGRTEIDLPIAWNETVGPWTVTATDLFTQHAATAVVQIR